jgi:N-acetylneuraminate synthase
MTYIIAEIGINHNGDINIAKKLIDVAKQAGCDAVKFQKRDINIVYTPEFLGSPRSSPWGITQKDQKEGLEFTLEEYKEIDAYCKTISIDWFASSWDMNSQSQMRIFDFKKNKIASAMASNLEFVDLVASEKKHTFMSTGMMDKTMIDKAVEVLNKRNCPFTLMHTVSTYPSREEDLNLLCIKSLQNIYGASVGYSGHEVSVTPSVLAVMLGAVAIERHITLDRAMYGSDQSASLEPKGLLQLVKQIRKIPTCLGDGELRILEEEAVVASKLRYWSTP